ncbi:hypothetical protein B194_4372 [Serratia plymuthica A30]|nr:hypothetical protein B194_4372 [Serratia plymuthica A30]
MRHDGQPQFPYVSAQRFRWAVSAPRNPAREPYLRIAWQHPNFSY